MDQVIFLRASAARLRKIAEIAPSSSIHQELIEMAAELEREAEQLERQGSAESQGC
jgi:hypothetical protein